MKEKQEYKKIILFDGLCNLCSWSVNFILNRDKKDIFRFASIQSETAKQILSKFKLPVDFEESVILIENNSVYFKSEAALRISKNLRHLWPLLFVLIIVPRFVRDSIYNFIAKNRFKWFGKKESCYTPEKNYNYKFL